VAAYVVGVDAAVCYSFMKKLHGAMKLC
jgi:hypothetical protein